MRISVSCSRAALVSFRASSSSRSVVHRPSFGSGWTSRSYARDVSPDRSILRTVFRDTRRSRAICLIVLPLTKCSRRIRPIVSTVSIPPPPASNQSEQRIRSNWRGSILDADNPLQGVKIARRITPDAVMAFADRFARRPIEADQALLDILTRRAPRLKGRAAGLPVRDPDEPLVHAVMRAVSDLDRGYLFLQGPPGTGKTYTAALAIVALLRDGKRVGVSSNSHKAI